LEGSEKTRYSLPDTEIDCIIQDREEGDESQVIYIVNPKHAEDVEGEAPYLAFTKMEYEVIEWNS
jgi:hypothetical protein